MAYFDRTLIPMLWTSWHQVFPMAINRAWGVYSLDGPKEDIRRYAQEGWELMREIRTKSDSPGRMAAASTALAQQSLASARGDTQHTSQLDNLVIATLGILKAEPELLALLEKGFRTPLNGDQCGRVNHAVAGTGCARFRLRERHWRRIARPSTKRSRGRLKNSTHPFDFHCGVMRI